MSTLTTEKSGPTVQHGRAQEPPLGSGVGVQCGAPAADESPDFSAKHKQFATLRAQCALAGWTLNEQPAGTFVVARWGMSRVLPDLAAVEGFVAQVGVRR
jgi:hypothetical protein